jgi:uncharacterized protein YndB with AHSA1/START domain
MLSGGPVGSEQSHWWMSIPGFKVIDVSGSAAFSDWMSDSPSYRRKGVLVAGKNDTEENGPYEITIVHLFDAPRELVFRNWVDAVDVWTWFAPDNCTVTLCEVDARPGGKWRVEYRYDFGGYYIEYGEFHEVVEPERLTFSLTQEDGEGNVGHRTLVTVRFSDAGAKTEMTFTQTGFETHARRDNNTEGWNECFRKLDLHMASARS